LISNDLLYQKSFKSWKKKYPKNTATKTLLFCGSHTNAIILQYVLKVSPFAGVITNKPFRNKI